MRECIKKQHHSRGTLLGAILAAVCLTAVNPVRSAQIVQVTAPDLASFERLQRAGLDITSLSEGGMAEVVLMNDDDRESLERTGLRYIVSLADAESYFATRLRPGRDDMGGYPVFDEIIADAADLHNDYPEIVGEPFSIGRSIEGRELWIIPVSDNPDEDEDEPAILITSLIHCREVITPLILLNIMHYLAENYGRDERATHLVDDRKVYFMPVVNPDGYVFNEETQPNGGGMWRKNRRDNGDGSIGVDLNRNFGHHWGYDNTGSSPTGRDETYRGTESFSEPETQAVREFTNASNISFSIFFHSYGNLCLYPYGYDYYQAPDVSLFAALSKRMIVANNYLAGTGWEVIYRTNGDSDDWMYGSDEHDRVLGYTFEVGTSNDSFWPPLNRVETLVNANLENCLTAIEYCWRPERVLQPPAPTGLEVTIRRNLLQVRWNAVEDEFNPAVSYTISTRLPTRPVVDDAPANSERWELINFNLSQADHHSGAYSYRAALQQPMATMTLKEEIVAPDTLRAWVNFTLRPNRGHYAALEASGDGWAWTPLNGELTQNQVVNNVNLGPGVTNSSNGWRETWWSLGEYRGCVVKLRFRTYQMYTPPNPAASEFFYVDDISPLPAYERIDVLTENLEATEYEGVAEVDAALEFYVTALDEDGDRSFASLPVHARDLIRTLVLTPPAGWSMLSLQVAPESLRLEDIYAPWIESNNLVLMKDGFGRFFSPRWRFNQIGEADLLAGYFVRLERADSLAIEGEKIPFNTPIPLREGWNLISYLPEEPMESEQALASIRENLSAAKDYLGGFWLPSREFNNLEPFEPGEGYLLKMAAADTLVYPAVGEAGAAALVRRSAHPRFTPPSPDNMSLIIEPPDHVFQGVIALFDEDGNLCGEAEVGSVSRIGIAAWGEYEAGGVGYAAGEPIQAVWRDGEGVERGLNLTFIEGAGLYQTNEFAVAYAALDGGVLPGSPQLSASPNPFNGATRLKIDLPRPAEAALEIFDAQGRLVQRIEKRSFGSGSSHVSLDLMTFPAGIYICRMNFPEEESPYGAGIKLLLIR